MLPAACRQKWHHVIPGKEQTEKISSSGKDNRIKEKTGDDTEIVRLRYDRIASIYDRLDFVVPDRLRKEALSSAQGKVLEVGVGTGRNLPLYPPDCQVTGIDISPGMLRKAKQRAAEKGLNVRLEEADVQNLPFDDDSFNTVVATCVFCSVPDPVAGLKEVKRVCRDEGRVILIEHVRSEMPLAGLIMDLVNPIFVGIIGDNINRRTVENVRLAGLEIIEVESFKCRIVKLIKAYP